ncbi:UDP-N-acetylmuramate--L-alanine ligase [Anaerosacchariphilus polymeriproducens]|uniref:UDP-N-acetylmuramate--L-alanine ligase n=1 Tax=Anaerosacchariphilus polymeriproducens TaxID=1812858 RepID=A0A371AZU3_9FIRM|nr:UDP-N-acetylmuramate--L-alanine ligase [Anaerosacchariphilus polymeriproducens]RDU25105.1 UDP-N-acetylmuramate--L-alanine ligase [Anaerosacchariphilus polymeriproducens]
MYKIDFKKPIHIHFIGIGGISMSGLAEILLQEGFQISGSDSKKSELTTQLEKLGAKIFYGQRSTNIEVSTNLVVYTAAIREDNPELMAAVSMNIPILTRAQLLGQIMENYETSIAVSGTHGKTTTTSMISQILLQADMDPTISVGGILKSINGNIRVGNSETFITEACEYTNSFLNFYPKISIILNIEEDHLDFFKDLDDIRSSFKSFADNIPDDGLLIINGEIENYSYITQNLKCKVLTYGLEGNYDFSAANIEFDNLARGTFDCMHQGKKIDRISLGVTGIHNISNALASISLATELGIDIEIIKKGLLSFSGTNRRFEYKGEIGGVTIIDDYAHHPTEIQATLSAAQNYPHKSLWCVFQPHTYTRTNAFLKDFAKSLSLADKVVLSDIYAAREKNTLGISSMDLFDEIKKLGTDVYYFPSFDEIENFLLKKCMHGDLLITMGAGDILKVGEELLGK